MQGYKLFTMGYEGKTIEDFICYLKYYKISSLIDVREIPLSRKKGFSKSTLRDRLESENINYVHIKALGSPAEARKKLYFDLDYDSFFKTYSKHLSKNKNAISQAHEHISTGNACLMCFEKEYDKCHRFIVAREIKKYDGNGLKIQHL